MYGIRVRLSVFFVVLVAFLFCTKSSFSQQVDYKSNLVVSQVLSDYNAVLLDGDKFPFDSSLSATYHLAYQRRFSTKWEASMGLANGILNHYNTDGVTSPRLYNISLDAGLRRVLFSRGKPQTKRWLAPFISVGYQVDYVFDQKGVISIPLISNSQYGVGFQSSLSNRLSLQGTVLITQKLQDDFNTFLQYRFGVGVNLGNSKKTDKHWFTVEENERPNSPQLNRMVELQDSLNFVIQQKDSISEFLAERINQLSENNYQLADSVSTLIQRMGPRYFVIISSAKNREALNRFAKPFERDGYQTVLLESSVIGYYRLGIEAGFELQEASNLLEAIKSACCSDAWLLYQ